MLIYNYQKKFLGIDVEDLKSLGFSNLFELRSESADFADMFVNTPGYVHNFTGMHWIDYALCSEFDRGAKVIIQAKNRIFKSTLNIKKAYLVDNPSELAYLIYLTELSELSEKEVSAVKSDIESKPAPASTKESTPIFDEQESETIKQTEQIPAEKPVETKIVEEVVKIEEIIPSQKIEYETDTVAEEIIHETVPKEIIQEDLETKMDAVEISTDDFANKPIVSEDTDLDDDLYDLQSSKPVKQNTIDDLAVDTEPIDNTTYDLIDTSDKYRNKGTLTSADEDDYVPDLPDYMPKIKEQIPVVEKKLDLSLAQDIEPLEFKDETIDNIDKNDENTDELASADDDDFVLEIKNETSDNETIKPTKKLEEEKENIPSEVLETYQDLNIDHDKHISANELGIDDEHYNEIFKDYVHEIKSIRDFIAQALEENDYSKWQKSAKKLKTMSDNMKFYVFMEELNAIINTKDKETAKESLANICNVIKQISE